MNITLIGIGRLGLGLLIEKSGYNVLGIVWVVCIL